MMTRLKRPLTLTLALALTAAVVLTSCSQAQPLAVAPTTEPTATTGTPTSAAPSATTTSPTRPPPSKSSGRRIEITVTGKQVAPKPATLNIAVGESLTIAVTSDRDNTLHAHGFEIAKDVKAGQRTEVTIKGAQPGVYEFELHDPELRLFQVAVR